ncbi:MAG TPA: NADH-quinone oxidoreductase subunit NuoE [Usitatibacter sp.]|jgi:NADH-quinone oxidoreductase subunit E|nr:NADH-quinone oxidoreductase subunit NuoE [Usitatibacter sp.]
MGLLSPESLQRIERETTKYPPAQRQSAVMSALAIAQDQFGWLSNEVMEEVAGVLRMPPVWVYEVATFYAMYNVKKPGRHKIVLCTNLPCALSGAERAGVHLREKCGVHEWNETSADGRFTVKEGECMGACADAPVMIVNDKRMVGFMSNEKIDELVEELK